MNNSTAKNITAIGTLALITDIKALNAAIIEVHASARTLQARHHIVLLSAVLHADTHKNNTPLLDFLSGIPNGVNMAAMILWLETFTAYDYKPAKAKSGQKPARDAKVHKSSRSKSFTRKADREKAASTPFYELKAKDKAKKPFDIAKYMANIATVLESKKELLDEKQRLEVSTQLLKLSQAIADSFDAELPAVEATTDKKAKKQAAKEKAIAKNPFSKKVDNPMSNAAMADALEKAMSPKVSASTSH